MFAPTSRNVPPGAVSRFDRSSVVYAGGSRYVATDDGWMHVAGGIEGPRLASDPGWLLAGPRGIGKATLAFRLARYLLAQGRLLAQDRRAGQPVPTGPGVAEAETLLQTLAPEKDQRRP